MNLTDFYQALLKVPAPWYVVRVDVRIEARQIHIWLEHQLGVRWHCATCQTDCGVYDHTSERLWRHLDTCQCETWLHAKLPRINCPTHGILQIPAPFSVGSSRFTLAMESHCIDILKECSRIGAERIAKVSWDQLDHIQEMAVKRGIKRRPEGSFPKKFGIDEKAVFKRHKYFTILSDLEEGTVYDVLVGRKKEDIEDWFKLHAEDFKKVKAMAMDMSKTYINLGNKYLSDPDNQLGFDKFHAIQHANDAVDAVRKEEQKGLEDTDERRAFFRRRYLFLYGKENVPTKRQDEFDQLKKTAIRTSKAWAIKESLRDLWNQPDEKSITQYFKKWFWWATHSRLKPVQKMAHTLNDHFQGILTAIRLKITNAVAEGLNSKIEKIKRDAYGYRNKDKLRTAILFHCGGLDLYPKLA